MLGVSAVFAVFCLSVDVSGGVDPRDKDDTELYKDNKPVTGPGAVANISFLFGAMKVQSGTRTTTDAVHFLQVMLATMVAGYAGFVLTVLWTAGFLPEFLQPSAASVLFAKPIPRWVLLVGKYLGVVVFVGFQVIVFFVSTWLALSLKTGVWNYDYLTGIPVLMTNFAVIYSFSVLIAVLTRSTVACVFGCVLFWLLCWATNYGHHMVLAARELTEGQGQFGPLTQWLSQASYWVLPKPADMEWILQDALNANQFFNSIASSPGFKQAIAAGSIDKVASVATSLVFAVVMLAISSRHLQTTDY